MKNLLVLALGILMLPLQGCLIPSFNSMAKNGEAGASNITVSTPWGTFHADSFYSKQRQLTNDFTSPYLMHPVTHQLYKLTPVQDGAPTATPPRGFRP